MGQISVTQGRLGSRVFAERISTCGFSPLGTGVALGGLVASLRRLEAGVPHVSTCSAALGAACCGGGVGDG